MAYEKVRELMESLKLTGMMNSLDFSLHNWGKGEKDVTELLEELLLAEVKEKSERRYLTALKYSGLPFHKTLEEFDFSFQPSIDRKQIMELKSLRFLYEKRMSFCLDLPGWKTHLAVALGMEALREGKKVYFVNAISLVDKLKKAFLKDGLKRR